MQCWKNILHKNVILMIMKIYLNYNIHSVIYNVDQLHISQFKTSSFTTIIYSMKIALRGHINATSFKDQQAHIFNITIVPRMSALYAPITLTNLNGAGFFSLLSINIFSLSALRAFKAWNASVASWTPAINNSYNFLLSDLLHLKL